MLRIALAGLIGAVILMGWHIVSWVVLPNAIPWHDFDTVPGQVRLSAVLKSTGAPTGAYWLPNPESNVDELMVQEWKDSHLAGPVAVIFYSADGWAPMSVMKLVIAFILDFLMAVAVAGVLALAPIRGYGGRLLAVVLIGVYVALGTSFMHWNFMNYPLDFAAFMAIDQVLASLLLGLVLAALVKTT